LQASKKSIVFYAETHADWAFLDPVIESLSTINIDVIRITSDIHDNYLNQNNVYFIGFGGARTYLFRTINVEAFVMTLTDLNTFYLKRSLNKVHYFYIFHSMSSIHRNYREHAFNSYDTIFCVGQHQIDEIRKTETVYNLKKKNLEEHGYGRLDVLIKEYNERKKIQKNNSSKRVLIAPTWGECSIVENQLENIIDILITNNYFVNLRLHPMTLRYFPNLPKKLDKKYYDSGNFLFDPNIKNIDSLIDNDTMISEWSGAALEFAFTTNKPVIFIDNKPKINNKNWEKIGLPCLEETIREKIGEVISPNNLKTIPKIIDEFINNSKDWNDRITDMRNKSVFNIGNSGDFAAKTIYKKLELINKSKKI